jgi:hypothetical protein
LASSSATRSEAPQSGTLLRKRLGIIAERLGTADPSEWLGDVLDTAFGRPLTDRAYAHNALVPGGLPLEVSFSEENPDQLRLDLQPSDVDTPAARRRDDTLAIVRRVGDAAFDDRCAVWSRYAHADRFGAFLGAALGPSGPTTVKAYLELDPSTRPDRLPGTLAAAAALVARHVPGVVPHLAAVAADDRPARVYLACREGLRVLALDGLLAAIGLRHRLPAVATAVAALTGRRLLLPEDAALIAIAQRRDTNDVEIKIELLADALAEPDMRATAVERLLTERPASLTAYHRWLAAVGQGAETTVVSVRLAGDGPPTLNIYQRLTEAEGAGA